MALAEPLQRSRSASEKSVSRLLMPVFAFTLCLSAFLLFSVQPFFAKMLLPRLGGSPAVWSIAMVFFQAVLLAGYAYAHFLARFKSVSQAAALHAVTLLLAFLVLPIAIPEGWDAPPASGQAFWLLSLFAVAVGLPFFAVSANGALLQAWFARSRHPQADDPYFLYGASNVGSFASLILYIVMFEPLLTLQQQSWNWTAGYGLLAISIISCALLLIKTGVAVPESSEDASKASIAWSRVAVWVALGFIPSGLLVGVTAHITTDVASTPFLWVLPLALFLLTFVLAFRTKPFLSLPILSKAVPLLSAVALTSIFVDLGLPVWVPLVIHVGFFFLAALYCHTILYGLRPPASRLTGFYLAMSFGGVLGGIFTSLAAQAAFNWVAEYPLLIVALLLVRPQGCIDPASFLWAGLGLAAVGGLFLVQWAILSIESATNTAIGLFIMAVVAVVIAQFRWRSAYFFCAGALLPLVFICHEAKPSIFRGRSFFGVVQVTQSDDGQFHRLSHGTTTHGAEKFRQADGAAVTGMPVPLTYYHAKGGIAGTIRLSQEADGRHFGIVGLGTGSVACYARPDESWKMFEIDQVIVDVARDPNLFRFMSSCGPNMPIILGDARLTLAAEADGSFDYLLIDAFSSDAIPTHLITREAIALFRSKLRPGGLLVFHISNRYLELPSVMAAIANDLGVDIRVGAFPVDPALPLSSASVLAVMTDNPDILAKMDTDPHWKVPEAGSTAAWTDDYSNIIAALLRQASGSR